MIWFDDLQISLYGLHRVRPPRRRTSPPPPPPAGGAADTGGHGAVGGDGAAGRDRGGSTRELRAARQHARRRRRRRRRPRPRLARPHAPARRPLLGTARLYARSPPRFMRPAPASPFTAQNRMLRREGTRSQGGG